jgi:hypothetical protein
MDDGFPVPADGSSQGMQVTPTQSPDDPPGPVPSSTTGCRRRRPLYNGLLIGGAIVGAFALGALLLSRE